ncbi:MAG: hypothetical protein Q9204_001935 [Flavoplaca sp. TL-2023a]
MTALATLVTIGRYIIRFEARGKFYYDDLAHFVAWILMIGCCATFQDTYPSAQKIIGVADPPLDAIVAFRKHQFALTTLFVLSLWFVKFAFMFLYRLLFWASPMFQKLWWGVMISLLITVWVPLAGVLTGCGHPSDVFNPVMILPWFILRKVQMRTAKKLGIGAIFSVVLITIACDILRTIKSFDEGAFSDSSLYTFLEVTLAVIVSCLPIYRRLFRTRTKKRVQKHKPGAFAPIEMGDAEQQVFRGTSVTVCASDKQPRGLLAKLTGRPSADSIIKPLRSQKAKSERQPFAPLVLRSLPSVHLGSVGSHSVHADDLV